MAGEAMRYVSEATGAVPKLREVSGGYLILGEDERTELCDMCADALPAYRGRGRPRVRCEACAANGAAISAAWRKRNPEKVEAFNAARRIPWHLQRGGV
jgi:hypothetical protein